MRQALHHIPTQRHKAAFWQTALLARVLAWCTREGFMGGISSGRAGLCEYECKLIITGQLRSLQLVGTWRHRITLARPSTRDAGGSCVDSMLGLISKVYIATMELMA
jgi:hypothetical protein